MRSSDFITETAVKSYQSEILDIDRAVELLNKHCRESLATIEHPLWRGMRNHTKPIVMIDPSTGERRSTNTTNYYTQIMSHSPYFEGWPKRNKSLICSTSIDGAGGYGCLYAIFPFDGAKIAVCPSWDIWQTRINVPGTCVGSITGVNGLFGSLGFPTSWESMMQYISTPILQKRLTDYNIDLSGEELFSRVLKSLSPEKAKFKLMSIAEFAANPPRNKECWVDSPVIAIKETLYLQFLDAVRQQKGAK